MHSFIIRVIKFDFTSKMNLDIILDELERLLFKKPSINTKDSTEIKTKPSNSDFTQSGNQSIIHNSTARQSFKWTTNLDYQFCVICQALGWNSVTPK